LRKNFAEILKQSIFASDLNKTNKTCKTMQLHLKKKHLPKKVKTEKI